MRHLLPAVLAAVLVASSTVDAQSAPAGSAAARAAPSPRGVPLSGAAGARYVGRYTFTDGAGGSPSPLRVYQADGVLLGQMRANTPSRLRYEGRHTFRPADAPEFQLVFAVSGAHATGVTMLGPNVTMRATRDTAVGPSGGAGAADPSQSGALYDELARVDSLLFDASYVRCDTARVNALLTDDVEFYHDVTGLHRGAEVRADFARLARNCPRAGGVRREVVPGSLRVYPVSGFGAVQTGVHRFVERGAGSAVAAHFVHVWRKDGGAWRASRVLSLDHRPAALP